MTIDIISIIACAIIIAFVAISVFANPFMRKIQKEDDMDDRLVDDENLPKITVLVLANNNAAALDSHLPLILTQDYAPGYEVVVVGEQGDMQTETVLKQFAQNKHLYVTYAPSHSLFMSKKKMAVALGVKAAHNEWIVLLNSNCRLQSDTWLLSIARHMDKDANLVIGYSNYDNETKPYRRFDRLRNDCYLLRRANNGTAYRANGTNIAFRRSEFVAKDGYRGNLQFVNGEYDFIVNKYAQPFSARIAVEEDAWVREDVPSSKEWHDRNIAFAHVRLYLEHAKMLRCLYNTDMILMHANYVLLVAALVLSAIFQYWIVLAVAVAGLAATVAVRTVAAKRVYEAFGEDINGWKTVFYEISIVWHSWITKIRYAKSDKRDFTTHKL